MFEILNSYLFQHKSISIPGLGTIFLERQPANADIGNQLFYPPSYQFRFDKYFDAPDKDFFTYLAAEKNIPDYEAIKWYTEFSYDLRNKIRQEDKAEWDDVGILKKDYEGNIVFEPASASHEFMRPVAASVVPIKESEHQLLVGDKIMSNAKMSELLHVGQEPKKKGNWWIYALILATAAIIVLLMHYYLNDQQSFPIGNQQKLNLVK